MKKIASVLLILLCVLGCADSSGDPYLNLNPELRIETRSLIVPANYQILADESRRFGTPFSMPSVIFKEGGNVAEVQVQFTGGCATHRFALYANSTYEDVANYLSPVDVTLYLYHSQERDECQEAQDHTLRRMDLSFLHPGLYNITIQNTFDRTSFRFLNYEIK